MPQVVQVNLVNVAALPAGLDSRIYGFSAAEQALWKVRRYYVYSVQTSVWVLALEKGFLRNAAWTDQRLIRKMRSTVQPLESTVQNTYGWSSGEHKLLFPMYLAKAHNELRADALAKLQNNDERLDWLEHEADGTGLGEWYGDYSVSAHFIVGDDMCEQREIVHLGVNVLNMYIPGNAVSWLVKEGLDPGKSDLYLRLENGSLLKISWWEMIPAPLPGSNGTIRLEVHSRNWPQRPIHIIRPLATPQCIECEFYAMHSCIPFVVWLPVLEGGWIIPEHHRELLRQNGFTEDAGTVVVHSAPRRSMALKSTTLSEPVAVHSSPTRPPILCWRALCARCYRVDPPRSYRSIVHFC